jgi:DNA-binding CsgD family transcriptional regulator
MKDPIQLVEAVYALAGDERQWLDHVTETFRPNLARGHGILAYTYDVTHPQRIAIRSTVCCDMDPALFAARAGVELPESEQAFVVPILRTGFVGTVLRSPRLLRRTGLNERRIGEFKGGLGNFFREWNIVDECWINAQDPTYFGCCFIVPSNQRGRWAPREAAQWRCVAAHVSAAFRIRRHFASADAAGSGPFSPEAILTPEGRMEHADRPAQGHGVRDTLRRAVLAFDKARGPLRHREPERAIALWQALVAGRWSLLDRFDSDGRRYVVAHRNDASFPDLRGLTMRQRQIASYAALGYSNKVIAYQLGLSTSTVSEHLARARSKLSALGGPADPNES